MHAASQPTAPNDEFVNAMNANQKSLTHRSANSAQDTTLGTNDACSNRQ
jgi:hypothetical protein